MSYRKSLSRELLPTMLHYRGFDLLRTRPSMPLSNACRNPFPEPLLLMIVLKLSGEHVGEVHDDGETPPVRDSGGGPARPTDDDERPIRRGSYGGGDGGTVRGNIGIESGIEGAMQPTRAPFVLLLKKTNDLVLQPFQALQVRQVDTPLHDFTHA